MRPFRSPPGLTDHASHARLRHADPHLHPAAPPGPSAAIAGWDQAANMPPKGNEARAAALAEMAALLHRMRTDPALAEQHPARRAGAAVRLCSAPTCARSGASGDQSTRCPKRWCSAGSSPRRAANTPGARSARPTTGPASCANLREVLAHRPRRGRAAVAAQRPVALRRADGPLRARHDAAPRSTACSATLRQWLPGLIRQVIDTPGQRSR